jgi:hypothetical protein
MHRSQAPYQAFMIRTVRAAAARNGAVSELRDAGELGLVVSDIARGGRRDQAANDRRWHGQDRGGAHRPGWRRAGTISRSLGEVPSAACS